MKLKSLTLFFWGFLIAAAAATGEDHRNRLSADLTGDHGASRSVEAAYCEHEVHVLQKAIDETD